MMLGMKMNQAKALFFDRRSVHSAVDKATHRVLSRFGAFVRTRARTSIRRPKKTNRDGKTIRLPSEPGEPPRNQTDLLRDSILFAYDPQHRSVVIGPVLLNSKGGHHIPETLEYGGTTTVDFWDKSGSDWQRKKRRVKVQARPFMGPAFEYVTDNEMPTMWRNSIK